MNITSYNVTDVAYHYIGLRVLDGLPETARREDQARTISKNVRKYVSDRALRLMLPEPRGTFETAGEKICQELGQLQLAKSVKGSYELTDSGRIALSLLNDRKHPELRRLMAEVHLQTYDNLRLVVKKHLELEAIWRPVVDASRFDRNDYVSCLLAPTFGAESQQQAEQVLSTLNDSSPRKLEDSLTQCVLRKAAPEIKMAVSIFRSMCDRLVSLRLLNQMRDASGGCEFLKSYTPCLAEASPGEWRVRLNSGESFDLYFCEPDMADSQTLEKLLKAICTVFGKLTPTAGYYDLPTVRDKVSELLKIPEAAFDEGLNNILDMEPRILTAGLQYEGITGRRKPLVRDRGSIQIHNLIRRI